MNNINLFNINAIINNLMKQGNNNLKLIHLKNAIKISEQAKLNVLPKIEYSTNIKKFSFNLAN